MSETLDPPAVSGKTPGGGTTDPAIVTVPVKYPGSSSVSRPPRRLCQSYVLFAYIAVLLLIYSVCYTIPYGFSDDYYLLYGADTRNFGAQFANSVENGRPIQAYLYKLTFSALHGVTSLAYLRMIGIVGIALCAWALFLTLRHAGMNYWPALFLPVIIVSLPTYQVFAAWAVCAYFPYSALLAGGALLLVERAYLVRFSKSCWLLIALATLMLLASLLVYQPSATMYWFFAAVLLLVRRLSLCETWMRFAFYFGAALPGFVLAYNSLRIIPLLLLGRNVVTGRGTLAPDILLKVVWFIAQPLVNALNLTNIDVSYFTAAVVGIFTLIGIGFYFGGVVSNRLLKQLLALLLMPLCYLPNLVVADDWASYRTLLALGPLIALYFVLAVIGFISLMDYVSLAQWKATAIAFTLGFFAVYSSMSAASNVTLEFALPQYAELQLVRSQLKPVMQRHPQSIYFISPTKADSIAPVVRYDEFGLPSSYQVWAPQGMVYLTLQQSDPADKTVTVMIITASDSKNLPAGSFVVDMRSLRYETFTWP